ncbi:MAG: hypothetical protein QW367_00275 [Candidatus Aenigmatarchaeota archaeon]
MGKVEEIIKILKERFNLSEEKIRDEIKEKLYEFGGLISEEGAAMLVAREYGIDIREIKTFSFLSELVSGMRNVNVRVKVFKSLPLKEFERKDGKKGYVKIFLVGDSSDIARLVFWNEFAEEAENMKIKDGDILKIYNARTKENIFGEIDIIVDKNTYIEFDNKDDLPSIDVLLEKYSKDKYQRLESSLDSIGYYEVVGIISAIYGNSFFFKTCPICGNKVGKKEEKYFCDLHGEVEPKNSLFLRFEVNTLNGNLRAVAFREVAEKIAENKTEELEKFENLKEFLENLLLGKIVLIRGRARKNKFLNVIELVVNEVENVNIEKEVEKLIQSIEN